MKTVTVNPDMKEWATISTSPRMIDLSGTYFDLDWDFYQIKFKEDPHYAFEELIAHFLTNKISVNINCQEMIIKIMQESVGVIGLKKNIKLQLITPIQIGFDKAIPLREFYKKAIELGLSLCPMYVGVFFCLGNNCIDTPRLLEFGSIPMVEEYSLSLFHQENTTWFKCHKYKTDRELCLSYSEMDHLVQPGLPYVFMAPDITERKRFFRKKFRKKVYPELPFSALPVKTPIKR